MDTLLLQWMNECLYYPFTWLTLYNQMWPPSNTSYKYPSFSCRSMHANKLNLFTSL